MNARHNCSNSSRHLDMSRIFMALRIVLMKLVSSSNLKRNGQRCVYKWGQCERSLILESRRCTLASHTHRLSLALRTTLLVSSSSSLSNRDLKRHQQSHYCVTTDHITTPFHISLLFRARRHHCWVNLYSGKRERATNLIFQCYLSIVMKTFHDCALEVDQCIVFYRLIGTNNSCFVELSAIVFNKSIEDNYFVYK